MDDNWEYDIELIGQTGWKSDKDGNRVPKESRTRVMANRKQTPRNEFYEARQSGIEIEEIFEIKPYEYNNEQFVWFECRRLNIYSTYLIDSEHLEIKCSSKIGDFDD